MTQSNAFLHECVEAINRVAPVSYRRIFNGFGIYYEGVQFALVINDQLYFRADEFSRGLFLAKKMMAFMPSRIEALESHFFQLPHDVLSHPKELHHWMRISVEAAQNSLGFGSGVNLASQPVSKRA